MVRSAHIQIGDQKYSFNDLARVFMGASKEEKSQEVAPPEEKVREDAGEFYLISRDFFTGDLDEFTDKYPFISAVAAFALGFFALMNVLSLSLTNIATGAFLGVLSVGLGKSLWRMENVFSRIWANAFNATKAPDEKEEEELEPVPPAKSSKV